MRARISGDREKQATDVLRATGLTISDAIRMMLVRIVGERALPFELRRVLSAEIRQAIEELRFGKGQRAREVETLFAELNAEAPRRRLATTDYRAHGRARASATLAPIFC